MIEPHAAERALLVDVSRRLVSAGLCAGTAGNASIRVDEGVLITPSGVAPDAMAPDDVCLVAPDGTLVAGVGPSSELPMHLVVYELTGAGAVVHTHSSVATALGTVREELPAIHYAITAFGGPVRVAPYALFGTTELAGGLRGALAGRTAALLANHGAVVSGRTLDEAYDHAVLLEWLCSVYWHASALGSPRVLGEGELDAVRAQMARLEYGEPR